MWTKWSGKISLSKTQKSTTCPRCHRDSMNPDKVINSLSHLDNKTYICAECGKQSGMCDMGYQNDIVEIEMHKRFKKELGL